MGRARPNLRSSAHRGGAFAQHGEAMRIGRTIGAPMKSNCAQRKSNPTILGYCTLNPIRVGKKLIRRFCERRVKIRTVYVCKATARTMHARALLSPRVGALDEVSIPTMVEALRSTQKIRS
jgi:hypothetical protein